jgi:hypothetical protein
MYTKGMDIDEMDEPVWGPDGVTQADEKG